MKVFSILKPAIFVNSHPQEDFFGISKKYPIFVVADGVSLQVDPGKDYPKKSGAGDVAKIFCETVIKEAEKKYKNFKESDLKKIFEAGNRAVFKYNASVGRTKATINYFDFDFFSATTSFLLIKNSKLLWWSLCDSGVTVFRDKEKIFQSPNGWPTSPEKWKIIKDEKRKFVTMHKDYRNAVKDDKLIGYGVTDGEETAKFYLNTGVLEINSRDLIFLYTDGFENYFDSSEFISIFRLWPKNLKNKLESLIGKKAKAELEKYGSEKTIIAISI